MKFYQGKTLMKSIPGFLYARRCFPRACALLKGQQEVQNNLGTRVSVAE